jgi:hypothetical protein
MYRVFCFFYRKARYGFMQGSLSIISLRSLRYPLGTLRLKFSREDAKFQKKRIALAPIATEILLFWGSEQKIGSG